MGSRRDRCQETRVCGDRSRVLRGLDVVARSAFVGGTLEILARPGVHSSTGHVEDSHLLHIDGAGANLNLYRNETPTALGKQLTTGHLEVFFSDLEVAVLAVVLFQIGAGPIAALLTAVL